jgi:DNA-binding NarL/FixJ family response regulator
MLRVGLVVDRAIYAQLLVRALAEYDGLEVVAAVDAPLDIRTDVSALDVVVVDVASPSSTLAGYVVQLRTRWPDVAVVLCSASSDRPTMLAAQASRVAALVDRTADLDTLVDRIRETEGALTVVSAAAIEQARHQLRTSTARSPVAAYPRLTEREREVLEQLSRGHTTNGIAGNLKISVNTCRGYMKTLMAKLGARSRVELMAFVAEHGLPPDRS